MHGILESQRSKQDVPERDDGTPSSGGPGKEDTPLCGGLASSAVSSRTTLLPPPTSPLGESSPPQPPTLTGMKPTSSLLLVKAFVVASGIFIIYWGSNPHPLQCEHEVLATRPPRKSPDVSFKDLSGDLPALASRWLIHLPSSELLKNLKWS
ncbi:unnamed protein product [Rangifer tarandus platyrhynchus]|uniref:Uncharacterized protein n=2 Tax=Rangifer tarandus platyrhynchus TaxID=3082113 RepID=A0ABN8ZMR3_RANTA|nr:unnamed protein product [Rangifer tarandus platyrhynchus]